MVLPTSSHLRHSHSSVSLLALAQVVFLTFFTTAQCDVGCPVLVPSVCLQVTCQNLTRSGGVDCLNPGAFIPQGTIATYRCIPHRGKDDMNRTYTMMCICDGKWMGIDRYVRFRDWCASNIDTGPFVEESESSPMMTPQDLQLASTSESGRLLGGETTNPSVPTTTMKFLEAVSTGQPLMTTGSAGLPTSTMQAGVTGGETTTSGPATATGTTTSETGTTTMLPATATGRSDVGSTGSTPSSASGSETTILSPNMMTTGEGNTETTPNPAFTAAGTGSTPLSSNETATGTVLPPGTDSTIPGSTNTGAEGQTTGSTTPYEGLTTLSPSAAGNVSSENMLQGKNNSREDGGRSLFSGNVSETTPVSVDTPTTAAQTGLPTGETGTPTGTGATGPSATGTTPVPVATTSQPGAETTGAGTTVQGAGATSQPGDQTATTPAPGEAGSTTVASFVTTTHEPMTLATGEPGTGEPGTGTTALPIQVTTTVASLTTTVIPGTESPVAPPENLQTSGAGNGTEGSNNANATGTGSAPSPGEEENCGDDHGANYTDYQLIGLQLHNTYRKMHNVSDVKLNQTLNEKAQAWAEHELTEKTLQVTPGKRNYAENLYKVSGWRAITPVRAVQEAMKTWYSSLDRYNWTQPNPTGFSQIVWGKTSDIGVGVAKKDDVTVVAVTYWPRGNIILVSSSSNGNQSVDSGKLFRENVFPKVTESELTPLP